MKPTRFIITESDEDFVSHSGLVLAGALLGSTDLAARADALNVPDKPHPGTKHADVLVSMIGLLCLGKADFAGITAFREDEFFRRSLGLRTIPSEPTLRQRMGEFGDLPGRLLLEESARMVRAQAPAITPCHREWVALDVDVSPFDNSGTKKEGLGWTYKKHEGFAPILAYLGGEGYLVNVELREGARHCQKGTPAFLRESISLARMMTDAPLLARLDAGNDAKDTLETLDDEKADFIVKRNLRSESVDDWVDVAKAVGRPRQMRPGKTAYVGETRRRSGDVFRRVIFEVTERTIDATGQVLLIPQYEVATYWTSLEPDEATPEQVIELYRGHGTSEQFHSEVKSDLDLERLPSGKFAVNWLVLTCGLVAYNVLRLIGQGALTEDKNLPPGKRMPIRKDVKRRRLRSVIQDLMYLAGRLVRHARRWGLSLARVGPWRGAWQATYRRLLAPAPG